MVSTADMNMPALKERVINILKTPKTEWPVIEAEATTTEKLYVQYIAPLAAIPSIGSFIGLSIVGVTLPFIGTYRYGIAAGLANAIVSYVLALVMVYVCALIISKLAPTFDSRSDDMQALKLVAYASTPAWLAGVLNIVPALAILGIIAGLYSIYLFYLGVPVMMKTPQPKVIPYMVVAALIVIVATFLVTLVSASITGVRYS